MKYPDFLQKNGTVGFAAPSFGCNIEPYKTAFRHSLENWKTRGFSTQLGPNVYEGRGIGISNTPEKCGREFMDMYFSKENDVLISCGGGELMCEDLEFLDFEKLSHARPKWFMGYSDNTNLTFLLATLCDTAAIYGPCAPAFGMEPWHPAIGDALNILTGNASEKVEGENDPSCVYPVLTVHGYDFYEKEGKKDEVHPLEPYNVTEPCVRKCFLPGEENRKKVMKMVSWGKDNISDWTASTTAEGVEITNESPVKSTEMGGTLVLKAEEDNGYSIVQRQEPVTFSGRLLGGCLDILVMLLGTKYDNVREFNEHYKEDGIIWFVEACDLNVMSIRRAVWQMKNAGWLEHVKGILVGRPYNGESLFGLDRFHAVTDLLADLEVPILMDLDIGHVPPMMPLVLGSRATVSMKGNDLRIDMELRP